MTTPAEQIVEGYHIERCDCKTSVCTQARGTANELAACITKYLTTARQQGQAEMRSYIEARLEQHRDNLAGWKEPDGYLVPTEPDSDERRLVRMRLQAAMWECQAVLAT